MYLPEREVTNAELAERMPASAEFLGKMAASTAITRRFWAPDDWAASDLALPACRQALERAGRKPEDVDLIVLGTDSPDFLTPATSVVLQHKLGAKNAGTFDVGCACASFPTGVAAAAGMIATNPGLKTVLVVGVYLMHKLADPQDPTISSTATAPAPRCWSPPTSPASSARPCGPTAPTTSSGASSPAPPPSRRATSRCAAGRTSVRFIERYPPEVNHEGWPKVVRQLAANGGFAVADIDFLIFTQVRKGSIELVMAGVSACRMDAHPHGDGEVGLHRLGLRADGPARRARPRARSPKATWSCWWARSRLQPGRGRPSAGAERLDEAGEQRWTSSRKQEGHRARHPGGGRRPTLAAGGYFYANPVGISVPLARASLEKIGLERREIAGPRGKLVYFAGKEGPPLVHDPRGGQPGRHLGQGGGRPFACRAS